MRCKAGQQLAGGLVLLTVAIAGASCGSTFKGSYSVTDVESAFQRAGFPLEEGPCYTSVFTLGGKACLYATAEPYNFRAYLRKSDYDAAAALIAGNGGYRRSHGVYARAGNLVVWGQQLTPAEIDRIETALQSLKALRRPYQ